MFRLSKTVFLTALVFAGSVYSQSSDQNYPTPITSSELSGVIKARDIGDSRTTTYYYAFEGSQGDIFINVVVKNLAGDIDIFTADGLLPLTKMVFYPDIATNETGRLIYLRKPERLLLRIQGRPPADDPATFRIKFGGSFIALAPRKGDAEPKAPKVESKGDTGIKVNSVGTILEVAPKTKPEKDTKIAETLPEPTKPAPVKQGSPAEKKTTEKQAITPDETATRTKPEVIVTGPPEVPTIIGDKAASRPADVSTAEKKPVKPPPRRNTGRATPAKTTKTTAAQATEEKADTTAEVERPVDPLASIHLVVELKNGDVIERPMSEVLRFSVDRGILVVIGKDGKTTRHPILDVAKVTIQ
nr:hypothetical protein [uncultured bacterium]